MEKIKDFKGWDDDRALARFSKINTTTFQMELGGYICWDFIEENGRMMYFTTDTEGKVITPLVNTRDEAMMDSANYLKQLLEKELLQKQQANEQKREDELKNIRENKHPDKDIEINR